MFNPWIYLSKDQMLQLLIIISVCIFGVQTFGVYDEKYSLSTTGPPEHVNSLEDAQSKCVDSWLLEIYDENVATLLMKLNVNIQVNGILLGMKRDTNTWRWSDGTAFTQTVYEQENSGRVVAYITSNNNQVGYYGLTPLDSAGIFCSKFSTKDKCSEWFHNGLCYFKPTKANCNWFNAHNECIKNGASMATFNNSETNFNMSFIGNQKYWVSLSRDTWNWTHAVEAVTFNKWSYGHPVFNDYQNCATTNSNGNEWKQVHCRGTYHIVCMREINHENPGRTQKATNSTTVSVSPNIYHDLSTQPSLPKPGGSTNFPEPTNAEPLSIGAKAGIGVGVSMLLIIIIIVGVLGFKNFHHCKRNFGRNNSRKPLDSENHYAEIVPGNNYTASTDNNPKPINYADLDLQSRGTLANDN